MDALQTAQTRYTAKHYDPARHVDPQTKAKFLEILRLAPSAVNAQPWHFLVVSSQEGKEKILPAVAGFNHPRVTESDFTVILCALDKTDDAWLSRVLAQEEADGRLPTPEIREAADLKRREYVASKADEIHVWNAHQVYLAMGFAMFAAAEMGLDTTAIEGFDPAGADEILGLREKNLRSVLMLSVGYRSEKDRNASRAKSRLSADLLFTEI